jgi:hypothetical protein
MNRTLAAWLWVVSSSAAVAGIPESRAQLAGALPHAGILESPAGRVTTVFGGPLSTGQTPEESASRFLADHAGVFGAAVGDLHAKSLLDDARPTQPVMIDPATGLAKFTLVYFAQERGGVPVFRGEARVLVRNEPGFPAVLARSALRDLADFKPGELPHPDHAMLRAAAEKVLPACDIIAPPRLVIFAGVEDSFAAPSLAHEILVSRPGLGVRRPESRLLLVEAHSGRVLLDESQVFDATITGSARGNATVGIGADTCGPEAPTPLPYLKITSGALATYADADGAFALSGLPDGPSILNATMLGRYFKVLDGAQLVETINVNANPGTPVDLLFNAANATEHARAENNAYAALNLTRDHLLGFIPDYPVIPSQVDTSGTAFLCTVSRSGSCNAFYVATDLGGQGSITHYRSGGGCSNFAEATIVAHEYGHHIVQKGGSGQGSYGEGMADTVALLVYDRPESGLGAFGNCAEPGRNADNTEVFPCTSFDSHVCGMALSGSVWDLRDNLLASNPSNYRQIVSALTLNSVLLHVGASVDASITVDFLTLDDDDADLFNGTPHFAQIAAAFAAHNLPAPSTIAPITLRQLSPRAPTFDPSGGVVQRVELVPLTGTPDPASVRLWLNTGSGYVQSSITPASPNVYEVRLPATPCATSVRYYLSAQALGGATVTLPHQAPTNFFVATSALDPVAVLADAFESDSGWTAHAPTSTATGGQWIRATPATSTTTTALATPDFDHSPSGTGCFLTGLGSRTNVSDAASDVDNGYTILLSPRLNLAGLTEPTISYWRWFYTNSVAGATADQLIIQISNNDGASWTAVELLTPGAQSRGGWIFHEFRVADVIAPTDSVRVRFIASDTSPESVIEAALDDFSVAAASCTPPCPADVDDGSGTGTRDGGVTIEDLIFFIDLIAAGDPRADLDDGSATGTPDGGVTIDDTIYFLARFAGGC